MTRRSRTSIDKELSVIQAQLEILRPQEAEYQRILDDVQRLKDSVTLRRQRLEDKQQELHSEQQPINWLPPELLIQIFVALVEADLDGYTPEEAYHRSPVIVSHVCSRWRSISLATSHLWSRISVQSTVWNVVPVLEFLKRSVIAPLDIVFIPPSSVDVQVEFRRADMLFEILVPHTRRIRSLSVQARGAAMQKLVGSLSDTSSVFSALRGLNLSLLSPKPSSPTMPPLLPQQLRSFGATINLRHLRLDKLPLFNIPQNFLPRLLTLELCFPPKKIIAEGPNSYVLRMSQLYRFLKSTPKLQELIMVTTVPFVDVWSNVDDDTSIFPTLQRLEPVELNDLRTIDWSYPYGHDVHYLLSFLVAPALERIDVGVEELPTHRPNVLLLRGYNDTEGSRLSQRILALPTLRTFILQCAHVDALSTVLRKFTLPSLKTLDLAYAGRTPAPLPRLETLFRDPRLPTLTHLLLARFALPAASDASALLGYLPGLTALTLTACLGAPVILAVLQQRVAATTTGGNTHMAPGRIRVCPRLKALTLERCSDVGISVVADVVRARNSDSTSGSGNATVPVPRAFMARPIKPLRKLHQGQADIASRMGALALEDTPTQIRFVRIDACSFISQPEAFSLRLLGVEEVVWGGVTVDELEDGELDHL